VAQIKLEFGIPAVFAARRKIFVFSVRFLDKRQRSRLIRAAKVRVLVDQLRQIQLSPGGSDLVVLFASEVEMDSNDNNHGEVANLLCEMGPIPHGLMREEVCNALFPSWGRSLILRNFQVEWLTIL
jgi:hypothetical protein